MKRNFTMFELGMLILVIAVLAAIIIPNLQYQRPQSKLTLCKSYLKNIGTMVNMYYSDMAPADSYPLPIKPKERLSELNFDGQTIDPAIINCRISKESYIWGPENLFTGSTESGLATDSTDHELNPKRFWVYQDGHVSSAVPTGEEK